MLLIAGLPFPGSATLGQPEQRIGRVASALHLEKIETKVAQHYSVSLLSSSDLVVKEYVHPTTKIVFGVTWRGTRMPDLLPLLGFDPATMKAKAAYRSPHRSYFETDTLVFESEGTVGRYAGRAVRLDLLPEGVDKKDIRP